MNNSFLKSYWLHFKGSVATWGWELLYWTTQLCILMAHLTHNKPTRWGLVTEEAVQLRGGKWSQAAQGPWQENTPPCASGNSASLPRAGPGAWNRLNPHFTANKTEAPLPSYSGLFQPDILGTWSCQGVEEQRGKTSPCLWEVREISFPYKLCDLERPTPPGSSVLGFAIYMVAINMTWSCRAPQRSKPSILGCGLVIGFFGFKS